MKSGASTISTPEGQVPYTAMSVTSTGSPTTRSTSGTSTAANGRSTRGKYTLLTSGKFTTRLVLEPVSEDAKYCIGSTPPMTSDGYGTLPWGKCANLPK